MKLRTALLVAVLLALGACGSIAEKTNVMTDDRLLDNAAGALGFKSQDLVLTDKRVVGTNTYVSLKSKAGREYSCVVNGGNALTFGMVNPPVCVKKGEALVLNPFKS